MSARPAAEDAWSGLAGTVAVVRRLLEAEVHRRTGLALTDCEVLAAAAAPPARRATMTELGRETRLSPSGVTRAVSRLGELGLVERRRDSSSDSRLLYVSATAAGAAQLAEAAAARHEVLRHELPARLDRLLPVLRAAVAESLASLDR